MQQNTIDCPSPEAFEHTQAKELVRMRYELIVQARREISEGRYDDDAAINYMLDNCIDRIAGDARLT